MIEQGTAVILVWLCLAAFFLRVLGQAYVALYEPSWLPPMNAWYSGLVPYGLLLLAQVLILQFMTLVAYDFTRSAGALFVTDPGRRLIITALSAIYGSIIAIRAILRLLFHPLRPWYAGRTVPILLHFVLAFFLFLVSGFPVSR